MIKLINLLLKTLDALIIVFIAYYFFSAIILSVSHTLELKSQFFSEILTSMSYTKISEVNNTPIIHRYGDVSNLIRSLFIFGCAAYYLSLTKDKRGRRFIIATALFTDGFARFITRAIDDPEFIPNYLSRLNDVWKSTTKMLIDSNVHRTFANRTDSTEERVYNSNTSLDSYFKEILSFFKLGSSDGYFDELYGFIWFSQVLLLIISVSILVLFLLYVYNNILIVNKEAIMNRVNDKNKILKFYVKYQLVLSRISFYFLPLLIIIGLLEIIYISNYLISHPLPVEKLPIDAHVYISTKNSIVK